jgi:hypothetical protein
MAADRTCGRTDGEPIGCHPEVMAGRAIYYNVTDAPRCARQHEEVGHLRRACAFGTGNECQHCLHPQAVIAALTFYSGQGRATLIHSCGRFPHEDLAGRPTACSDAGDRPALRVAPPGYGEKRRGNSRAAATAMQVPIWARRFMMTSGAGAMAWASNRLWAHYTAGHIGDDADIGCRFPVSAHQFCRHGSHEAEPEILLLQDHRFLSPSPAPVDGMRTTTGGCVPPSRHTEDDRLGVPGISSRE